MNEYRLNKYLRFFEYLNDVKGFYPYVEDLKNDIFRFKNVHIEKAKQGLFSVIPEYSSNDTNDGIYLSTEDTLNKMKPRTRSLVSIHIRLTDYGKHLKKMFQLPLVNSTYFTKAMSYLTQRDPVNFY